MSITYTNRKGKTYYLHQGVTKKGNPKYHFALTEPEQPVDAIPKGYEIYENPQGQVFLRRRRPKQLHAEELAIVEQALQAHPNIDYFLLDVKDKLLYVYTAVQDTDLVRSVFSTYHPDKEIETMLAQNLSYDSELRFELHDPARRTFVAWRYCFLGSVDDWIPISQPDSLDKLATTYIPLLGDEEFYTLY